MKATNEQQKKIKEIVMERANLMLQNEKINSIYQSFQTKDEAETWLINAALATLIIPVKQRQ